jgi:eukaryotic-like serine/threonine-protein kinase
VLHEIASQQPAAPRRAGFLEPVLVRMLDRDPRSRWSMADAAHALHRLAQEHAPERTRADTFRLGGSPAGVAASSPRLSRSPASPGPPGSPGSPPAPVGAATDPGEPADPSPASSPPAPRETDRRSRRGGLAALVAIAVLLVAGGIGYAVFQSRDGGQRTGSASSAGAGSSARHGSSSPGPSATASGSATGSGAPSRSGAPTSPASTDVSSSPPASRGLAAKVAFLQSYFGAVPGGSDQAWNELTPAYQRQVGRSSFVGFWKTIDSVEVSDVVPVGGGSVDATLTYLTTKGTTSTERHRIDLVRSGGGYRIGGDRRA